MRFHLIRFFVLLGLLFPALASAVTSNSCTVGNPVTLCYDYTGDAYTASAISSLCASGGQTYSATSCPTEGSIGNCLWDSTTNSGINSFSVHYYSSINNILDASVISSLSTSCTSNGAIWSSTNVQPQSFSLSVSKPGTGSGIVTSSDGHIDCGSTCDISYSTATIVFLNATPDTGFTFDGWGGSCTGTGACEVTMDTAKSVTATFSPVSSQSFSLSISKSGTGSGTVTSSDGHIDCGSSCGITYNSAASVSLSAIPAAGSTFDGWGGSCTGTGSCNVTMDAVKSVTATFNPVPFVAATTGVTDGIITAPIATVTTIVAFNPTDVGKPQSVFVTAWAPVGPAKGVQQSRISTYTTMKPLAATSSNTFVLVQLTSSGWQPVVNGELIPYVSGVIGDQSAAISILDNTSTAGLLGTQFCVGYGTSAADMKAAGRMQLFASIPNPDTASTYTGSCNVTLPISNTVVFGFVEANYPNFFTGTATSAQISYQGTSYDYRYYPATQNYLAVDTSSLIYIYGPISANVLTAVGPAESFRNVITEWEGSQ